MRLKKIIETDNHEHEITASYVRINNDHIPPPFGTDGDEERISLGFITESAFTEELLLWGEGVWFENHPLYRSPSRFMLSTGGVFQVSDKVFLSGEFNMMNDFNKNYAAALWWRPISKERFQTSFGFEYRYTSFDDNNLKDEHNLGALVRLHFYGAEGFRIKK